MVIQRHKQISIHNTSLRHCLETHHNLTHTSLNTSKRSIALHVTLYHCTSLKRFALITKVRRLEENYIQLYPKEGTTYMITADEHFARTQHKLAGTSQISLLIRQKFQTLKHTLNSIHTQKLERCTFHDG